MARITILGAGITGLSIATILLQRNAAHKITIVARDLPGDPPSQRWASPWACAGWVALGGATALERQMQLNALAYLQRLALEHPESGARIVELTDVFGSGMGTGQDSADGVWFAGRVAGYEVLREGDVVMVRYGSVVVVPAVFLPWMRKRLEASGVTFERVGEVKSLGELKGYKHDLLVNASGIGAMTLEDVKDGEVSMDRTHVTVVRSDFEGAYVHRGPGVYTYIFGRGDGTAVVGGLSEPAQNEATPEGRVHEDLFTRAFEHLPEYFPSPNPGDYEVVEDLTGIRPLRLAGVRAEAELLDGQRVFHAYGTTVGGYILSFGLAQHVVRLVEGFLEGSECSN